MPPITAGSGAAMRALRGRQSAALMGSAGACVPPATGAVMMRMGGGMSRSMQTQQRTQTKSAAAGKDTGVDLSSIELPSANRAPRPQPVFRMEWSKALQDKKAKVDAVLQTIKAGTVKRAQWTPVSKRIGLVGRKLGMMSLHDLWGEKIAVTVLEIQNCQVINVKAELSKKGLIGVQIGGGHNRAKRVTKPLQGHYMRAGASFCRKLVEFPVTPDAVLPLGLSLSVRHFLPGQLVDVYGVSVGKGTQGGVRRWGFKTQPKSHGNSLSHRVMGSSGARGSTRVFPGKKMHGRMGYVQRTVLNLQVHKVDVDRNLLYVKGGVPGKANRFVAIRDAIKPPRKQFLDAPPPFPTWLPGDEYPVESGEIVAPKGKIDPFPHGA